MKFLALFFLSCGSGFVSEHGMHVDTTEVDVTSLWGRYWSESAVNQAERIILEEFQRCPALKAVNFHDIALKVENSLDLEMRLDCQKRSIVISPEPLLYGQFPRAMAHLAQFCLNPETNWGADENTHHIEPFSPYDCVYRARNRQGEVKLAE